MSVKRRGIHTRPNRGATDEWISPPELVESLGPFDLDPCAHPRQFYQTARLMISPPADGLSVNWTGMVWLNPPFSQMRTWLPKLVESGRGIALLPARTEVTSWFWPFVWEAADAILFLRGRLYFLRPDGTKAGNAGHGSVIAAYSHEARDRVAAQRGLGRFFDLRGA